MMTRPFDAIRVRVRAALAVAGLLAVAVPAEAVVRSWRSAVDGSYSAGANWSPTGAPGPLDEGHFSVAGAYNVTLDTPADSVLREVYDNGTVRLSATSPHRVSGQIALGQLSSTTRVLLAAGRLAANRLDIGTSGGASAFHVTSASLSSWGAIELRGAGAKVSMGSPGGGARALIATGGGQVSVGGPIEATVAVCSLSVAGGGLLGQPRSAIRTTGATGSLTLGVGSRGYVDVWNGGVIDLSGDLVLGQDSTTRSLVRAYKLSGATNSPQLTVRGATRLGDRFWYANGRAGSATLSIEASGSASFGGLVTVSTPYGSAGDTLRMTGGFALLGGGLRVHSDQGGALELKGGLMHVAGGPFRWEGGRPLLVQGATAAPPMLWVANGRADTVAAALPPGATTLAVGGGSGMDGSLMVRRAGTDLLVAGTLDVGEGGAGAGSGALQVDSLAILRVTDRTRIAGEGTGTLSVLQGAQWRGNHLEIARRAGSHGNLTVTGAGSLATAEGDVSVGGTPAAAGGTGELAVTAGAQFQQSGAARSFLIHPNGSLYVGAQSMALLASAVVNHGTVTLEDGQAFVTSLGVRSGALLKVVHGLVRGTVHSDAGGLIQVGALDATRGHSELGDRNSPNGVDCHGALTVTLDTLTLRDADGARLGTVTLNDASLDLPEGGLLTTDDVLAGAGRLTGSLVNEGMVLPNGAVLHVGGRLDTPVGQVFGGVLHVESGGSLVMPALFQSVLQNDGRMTLGPVERRVQILPAPPASATRAAAVLAAQGGSTAFTQGATGVLSVRIGPRTLGASDTLAISDGAQLGGRLELHTLPGYLPAVGDTFVVLLAGTLTGTFADVTINDAAGAGRVAIQYGPTFVNVTFTSTLLGVSDPPPAAPGVRELRFASSGPPRDAAFALELPERSLVRLAVYDVAGRVAAVLADGELAAGRHRFPLSSASLRSGVYFGRAAVRGEGSARVLVARVTCLR